MIKRPRNRERQLSSNENIERKRSRTESIAPDNSQKDKKKENRGRKRITVPETRNTKTNIEEELLVWSESFEKLKIQVFGEIIPTELECYRRYVMKKFNEIMAEYNETIEKIVQYNFMTDVMTMPSKKFIINDGRKGKDVGFSNQLPIQLSFYSTSTTLPRIKNWCHTEINKIKTENDQLINVPFIGNVVKGKQLENSLLNRISDKFIEGVHGAHPGCGKIISRYQVYRLLKTLRESNEKDYFNPEERKKIDFSIFNLFPNATSYKDLKSDKFFYILEKRFLKKEEKEIPLQLDYTFNTFCLDCRMVNCSCSRSNKEVSEKSIQWQPYWPIIPVCFSEGFCSSGVACGSHLDFSENFAIPIIECSALKAVFLSQLTKQQNICELTRMMNNLFLCSGYKEMSCIELTKIVFEASRKKIKENPNTKMPRSDRHKIFRTVFQPPSDVKAVDNAVRVIQCSHKGACEQVKCPCFINRTACSLKCKCAPDCNILFPGCRCRPGGCRSNHCPCFFGGWECQPKLCGSCNSNIFEPKGERFCQNIAMQHGLKKKIGVGISTIPEAGMGLFVQQTVRKDELIGEYAGEVISEEETERRGVVYDQIFMSYMFNLVKNHQTVDSGRVGNLLRFANNKSPKDEPNCYAKIIKVQETQKIGIYASRNLTKGEELFFDYGYSAEHATRFK